LVAGVFFLGCVTWNQFRLAVFGKATDGVVVEGKEGEPERIRHRGGSQRYTVRFTPENGEPVEFKTSSTFGTELKWGDAVKVIYMPKNPTTAEIYSAKQLWLPMMVGLFVGTTCLGGGLLLRLILRVEGA
jgi:hypothetical protein